MMMMLIVEGSQRQYADYIFLPAALNYSYSFLLFSYFPLLHSSKKKKIPSLHLCFTPAMFFAHKSLQYTKCIEIIEMKNIKSNQMKMCIKIRQVSTWSKSYLRYENN